MYLISHHVFFCPLTDLKNILLFAILFFETAHAFYAAISKISLLYVIDVFVISQF